MHDFNGGILPSGLFWTLDVGKTAVDFKIGDRRAVLHVKNLPVYDYREALRPPTRFLPFEEEGFGEEES